MLLKTCLWIKEKKENSSCYKRKQNKGNLKIQKVYKEVKWKVLCGLIIQYKIESLSWKNRNQNKIFSFEKKSFKNALWKKTSKLKITSWNKN